MDKYNFVNLAIWINGNDKLKVELDKRTRLLEAEIDGLRWDASAFHKKKVGRREYWYRRGGRSGVWKYVCPATKNPAKEIEKGIARKRKKVKIVRDGVNRAVVKPFGRHLIIDLDRFVPSDGEVISFLEIYETVRELEE